MRALNLADRTYYPPLHGFLLELDEADLFCEQVESFITPDTIRNFVHAICDFRNLDTFARVHMLIDSDMHTAIKSDLLEIMLMREHVGSDVRYGVYGKGWKNYYTEEEFERRFIIFEGVSHEALYQIGL